jgi:hypothetical protein
MNFLEFIYFAIKHKKLGLYFKAKVDALKVLPKMFEKRRKIMKNKKVSNTAKKESIRSWFLAILVLEICIFS